MNRLPPWSVFAVVPFNVLAAVICLHVTAESIGEPGSDLRIVFTLGTLNAMAAAVVLIVALSHWYLSGVAKAPSGPAPYLDPRISPESLPTMRPVDDEGLSSRSWPIAKAAVCAGCQQSVSACTCFPPETAA